jgi:bifunctional non-homologous end joining protein LigD
MVEAFGDLPARAAVLDGELVFFDAKGQADFRQLNNQMRTRWPDETQLVFMMFDLLHENGVDLRGVPLSERKRDLNRLSRKADVPFMRQVETFLDGAALFAHSAEFGLEGVVSKRIDQPHVSGLTKYWVKSNQEKGGARPCSGAAAGSRSTPRHRARAAQAHRHPGAGNRRIGAGLDPVRV